FEYFLCRRDHRYSPVRTAIFGRSIFHIQNPTTGRINRWSDRCVGDRDYTLAISELAGCPDSEVAARRQSLKHDNCFEGVVTCVATIDLQLVRLDGDLIFPLGRGLMCLNQLDIRIRVIDPDRRRASALTGLFNSQRGLVVLRVCGAYFQNRGCGIKRAVVGCDGNRSHRMSPDILIQFSVTLLLFNADHFRKGNRRIANTSTLERRVPRPPAPPPRITYHFPNPHPPPHPPDTPPPPR